MLDHGGAEIGDGEESVLKVRWVLAAVLCACVTALFLIVPVQQPTPVLPFVKPSATSEPAPKVTVALSGDVLIHNTVAAAARRGGSYDFRPLLAGVRRTVSEADIAICHLETPIAPDGGPYESYPLFSVPPHIAPALKWAGYDACTTASNHSVDKGYDGVRRTLAALDRAGLKDAGTARSPKESRHIVRFESHGASIALLSYTFSTNGLPVVKPWSVNLIRAARIKADAARARAEGADAVLVAMHWGTEYQHEPSSYQMRLARLLTKSPDITFIYGHHAHVVQPIRRINGKVVIFGLGNLMADQAAVAPGVDQGMIAQVTLGGSPMTVESVTVTPTLIDSSAHRNSERVIDVRRELKRSNLDQEWRALLRRTLRDVMAVAER